LRFGISLYLWTTDVTADHMHLLPAMRELGYDGVEVPVGSALESDYGAIRAALDDAGLACTTITNVGPEKDTVSPEAATRAKALEELRFAIEQSRLLGSDTLVGPYQAAYANFQGRGPTEEELDWSADVMREAAALADEAGIKLGVEFLNRHEGYLLNTMGQSAALAKKVGHPAFGVLYDTHHAHAEEHDIGASIRDNVEHIHHVHFSESNRAELGAGLVHWDESIAALKDVGYDRWVVAEAFASDVPGLSSAAHVWRDTFPSKDSFAETSIGFMRRAFDA
jgi:D-psicose/D-tagatose/L-ribulose 3-epimerase